MIYILSTNTSTLTHKHSAGSGLTLLAINLGQLSLPSLWGQ